MSEYPEHEKLAAVKGQSQAIGLFIDTCGYELAEYSEDWDDDALHRVNLPIEQILANYFQIDLKLIETEKSEMIAAIRESKS